MIDICPECKSDPEGRAYLEGQRIALTSVIETCLRKLGYDDDASARQVVEHERTDVALRRMADDLGLDSDWPAGLDLVDVIEKRIARYLGE